MTDYHEPQDELSEAVRDLHRALSSLKEEIEAVDWYTQRAHRCGDPQLKRVIEHNRDEEIEHACMTLEWLRRTVPAWDAALRTYLFQTGDIVEAEEAAKQGGTGDVRVSESSEPEKGLGVGSLKNAPGEGKGR
jgi:ferritin-like protein